MENKYKFLFIDAGGLGVDAARKVGQEGHKVWYFCSWQKDFANFSQFAPGTGLPEIEKVLDFGKYIDEADCIVFPYVGFGDLAHFLRKKGYVVFGAGAGEEIEQDRPMSLKIMDQIGIKYPESHVLKGVPEAMKFLGDLFKQKSESNQNATGKYFVKFNVWRGDMDSFPVANLDEATFMFDSVKAAFGPYANEIPITIQKTVEGIETGADLFFNGETFLMPGMWGFEHRENYVGLVTEEMGIFRNDLDRAAKYLRSVNYRGAFSFECIYDGKDCYWIDWTCRFPLPLGLMYCNFIENYGEFLLRVATGEADRSPLMPNRYLGCMAFSSEEALSTYVPIKRGQNTKLMKYMVEGDKTYIVPGVSLLGICCAQGDTLKEIEEGLKKESEELSVFFGSFNPKFIDDVVSTYVEPISKMGVSFGAESPAAPAPAQESIQKSKPKHLQEVFDRWGIPKF